MDVFVSTAMKQRYPHIYQILEGNLQIHSIDLQTIDAPNIWIRDWAPIRTNSHYTKFQYKVEVGDYDKWPSLKFPSEAWNRFASAESTITLDGGNVEQSDECVLMTEIVFKHNPHIDPNNLITALEKVFDREIIFLPVEPGDEVLGHIDGIARFSSFPKTVIVNDYEDDPGSAYDKYQKEVRHRLELNGFEVVYIPNIYWKMPKMSEKQFRAKFPLADDFNPGYGYYVNFYRAGNALFMPAFHQPEDAEAYNVLKKCFPTCDIIPVNCEELSMLGGLLNCTTWEYQNLNSRIS